MARIITRQLLLGLPRGKNLRSLEPSESQLELGICHYLYRKGFFVQKLNSRGFFQGKIQNVGNGKTIMVGKFRRDANPYARPGLPDLWVAKDGLNYFLEVKTSKGVLSQAQKDFHEEMRKFGLNVFVVRSIEDVETILGGK